MSAQRITYTIDYDIFELEDGCPVDESDCNLDGQSVSSQRIDVE